MADFTAIISGAGPAGLAAAILLAQEGVKTALVSPVPKGDDPRTTALMDPAIRLFRYIHIWDALADHCAPLKELHLVDDMGGYVSAPHLAFKCEELELEAFGYNVPLALLVPALQARATALGVHMINEKAIDAVPASDHITLTTESGLSLSAQVLLIADGANSVLRQKLGFAVEVKQLDQMALVAMFDHSGPHHNVSTEFHKPDGPFTTVPMPGSRSSLVWMAKPAKIEALMALTDQAFATEIQLESHGLLGKISNPTLRKSFAMKTQSAYPLGKARALLIGEAGHQLTPIGAQGLNLSLRDAGVAADLIIGAEDAGSAAICADFDKQRRVEVNGRLAATGFLNSSLMSAFDMMHLARATGLAAIALVPLLRREALSKGLYPPGPLPFAMR
ncbi:MAG TPA: FAD-dependent monooxygenase [Aestuariivirga sp.]